MELVVATNNPHKISEIRRIMKGIKILTPKEINVSFNFEETGQTFEENSKGKARHLFNLIQKPTIADDSGLSVKFLNEKPGIHSARFGPPNNRYNDKDRMMYLLSLLANTAERDAKFICCVSIIIAKDKFFVAQETVAGKIALRPQGSNGFGYDPVFLLPNLGKSMAELSNIEKDQYSHRGKALRSCLPVLQSY